MSTDRIRVVTGCDSVLVEELVDLHKNSLSPDMQFEDPAAYFLEGLEDPSQHQHCHEKP